MNKVSRSNRCNFKTLKNVKTGDDFFCYNIPLDSIRYKRYGSYKEEICTVVENFKGGVKIEFQHFIVNVFFNVGPWKTTFGGFDNDYVIIENTLTYVMYSTRKIENPVKFCKDHIE